MSFWDYCEEDMYSYIYIYILMFWLHCTACGILVPRPGIEHLPPTLKVWSLNSWTTREVFFLIFLGELLLISTLLTCHRCFYSSLSLKSAWLSSFWIKLPSQPSPWLVKSLPPLHFPQSRLLSLHTPAQEHASPSMLSIISGPLEKDEGEKLCRQKECPLGEGEERKVRNIEELILPSFPFPLL